jgi:type I site-specific restriction endonuclease
MILPEQAARETIDAMLADAGWTMQSRTQLNLGAARGVAMREFALKTSVADYLLFVDRKDIGAVEAKPTGTTLSGIEVQSEKYGVGLPALPRVAQTPALPLREHGRRDLLHQRARSRAAQPPRLQRR